MSTPLVDCHTHTSFSDGTSTFEQNVAAAARAARDAYRYAAATGYAGVDAPTPDGDWQTFSL